MIQTKTRILRTVIDRNGPFLLANKMQEAQSTKLLKVTYLTE